MIKNILKRVATVMCAVLLAASVCLLVGCNGKKKVDVTQPVNFPLDKAATLTWYYPWGTTYLSDYEDLNEHPFMVEMQEKTNIKIEFTYPTMDAFNGAGGEYEGYLASEEYFDMVTHNWYFPSHSGTTIDGAIDDGIYTNLTELVKIHMPNFQAYMNKYSSLGKLVPTQNNNILYIPKVYSYSVEDNVQQTSGLVIRQDMLSEYQLEAPTTISEWYAVLKELKVSGGVEYPVQLGYWGGPWTGRAFFTAYGVDNTHQFDEDGNIVYAPMLDGTKEYLTEMNKWYNEGLIAYGEDYNKMEYKQSNDMAAFWTGADELETLITETDIPGYALTPVQCPTLEKGDVIKTLGNTTGTNITFGSANAGSVFISQACEYPHYALAWLDLFYTDEMYYRTSYGIENEDYTKNADGTISFTDKIKNDPEGMRWSISHNAFLDSMYRDSQVFVKYAYSDQVAVAITEWSKGTGELTIPADSIRLTAEETELMANSVSDYAGIIWGLRAFLVGESPMTEWDSYVAKFYDAGVEEQNAIYQTAYERWLAS